MWYPYLLDPSEQDHAATHLTSYPTEYPAQPVREKMASRGKMMSGGVTPLLTPVG